MSREEDNGLSNCYHSGCSKYESCKNKTVRKIDSQILSQMQILNLESRRGTKNLKTVSSKELSNGHQSSNPKQTYQESRNKKSWGTGLNTSNSGIVKKMENKNRKERLVNCDKNVSSVATRNFNGKKNGCVQNSTTHFNDGLKNTNSNNIIKMTDASGLKIFNSGDRGIINSSRSNKLWSDKRRKPGLQHKDNKCDSSKLFKILQSLLSNNDDLIAASEIKLAFMNFEAGFQDKKFLIDVIHMVNLICSSEVAFKIDVVKSMCQQQFLKAMQTFIIKNTKEITNTEEGRTKYGWFFQNLLQISKFGAGILPIANLSFLNHALILSRSVLDRIVYKTYFQQQLYGLNETIHLLCDKIGKLELDKEAVSLSDIDDMRQMSIYPTKYDLFGDAPELKKNIVEGAYKSVDHYLTVQFMLLREDFVAPLREGIVEHLAFIKNGPFRKKSSVFVYQHVRILRASINSGKLGHEVKLEGTVKWSVVSNHFIFGSLLLFSTDNFQSFFLGTVIEVDNRSHTIMVNLHEMHNLICENLYVHEYEMAASKVFFEPYFHVLNALQKLDITEFPMAKYIIEIDPNPKPPEYIKELGLSEYNIYENLEVNILDPVWPTIKAINFNPSQMKAFQAALTKEFVAIQGPPGTGKTFLALQIVSTLLDNVQTNTPILVVCYKNHALDQFLEGLMKKTQNIVRIGGRSKNENLMKFNIKVKRAHNPYGYKEFGEKLQSLAKHYFEMQNYIDNIKKHGIVAIEHLLKYIPSPKLKSELMNGALEEWLMEGVYAEEEPDTDPLPKGTTELDSDSEHALEEIDDNNKIELQTIKHFEKLCIDNNESDDNLERVCNSVNSLTNFYHGNFEQDLSSIQEEDSDVNNETLSDYQKLEQDNSYLQSEESKKRMDQIFMDDDDFSNIYNNVLKQIQTRYPSGIRADFTGKSSFNEYGTVDSTFSVTIRDIKNNRNINESSLDQLRCQDLNEDVMWRIHVVEESIKQCTAMITFLNKMIHKSCTLNIEESLKLYALVEKCGIWSLTTKERWSLYHFWIDCLSKDIKKEMIQIERAIRSEEADLEIARNNADLKIIQQSQVVGLTTTGAAKFRPMLNELGAKIVVIEEAAEVLESHVVTALSSKCQHLILIGDHLQLRPNPAVYQLCTKYNFDISLFERMIKNGLDCHQLNVQHRMRPEISSLIVPTIYSDLTDHPSVRERPDINGVRGNLFFINHNQLESKIFDSVSHENKFEADYAVNLAVYLLKQGYNHEDITILATYQGQTRLIIKKLSDHNIPRLRTTTVDDFQGEENKIIILSLVRSNEEDSIGFLKTENRVCVALSRARDGFFIIGNMDVLSRNSKIWTKIKETLIQQNALGNCLTLYCQNHPETFTEAGTSSVFKDIPEGGCRLKCTTKLSCGHKCKYYCHPLDQEHTDRYRCSFNCERKICKWNHNCPLLCGDSCKPCKKIITHQLPCSHEVLAACSISSDALKCDSVITMELPLCGHKATTLCCNRNTQKIKCENLCGKMLSCGHPCAAKCHAKEKMLCSVLSSSICRTIIEEVLECGHVFSEQCHLAGYRRLCMKKIEKLLPCGHIKEIPCCDSKNKQCCSIEVEKTLKCGHKKKMPCNMPEQNIVFDTRRERTTRWHFGIEPEKFLAKPQLSLVCEERCLKTASCGHQCEELCSAPCKCKVVLEKIMCCGHAIKYACGSTPNNICNQQCTRVLPCGHPCPSKCFELCDVTKCKKMIKSTSTSPCGHILEEVPCYISHDDKRHEFEKLQWCKADCEVALYCGHRCPGKCGQCNKTNIHETCNKPCEKMLPCGHQCAQLCKDKCAPCQRNCLNHCRHRNCSGICGEYCPPCKEMCPSKCRHSRCTRSCSYYCNRLPCELPCQEPLKHCGHPCLGLCGEVCPQLCPLCMPQVATIFGPSKPRLIMLEDCGHIHEAKRIDELFYNNYSNIVKCPEKTCLEPIISTKRYLNNVRQIFSNIRISKRQMQQWLSRTQFEHDRESKVWTGNSRYGRSESHERKGFRQCQYRDYSKRGGHY